tara:strand:+ start:223 stop:333 length:111 start_codon:yes stop_codon:yes gene_type:complete
MAVEVAAVPVVHGLDTQHQLLLRVQAVLVVVGMVQE